MTVSMIGASLSEERFGNDRRITSGEIIGCPVFEKSVKGPLHIFISTDELEGFLQCEKLALLDLTIRGYKKISTLKLTDRINIVDAVQGIFDYV